MHSIVCRKPNRIGSSLLKQPLSFPFLSSSFFASVQFNWMSLLLSALLSARFVHRFILTSRLNVGPYARLSVLSAPSSFPSLYPHRSLLLGRYRRWLDLCPALPADPIRSDPIFIVSGRAEPPHSSRMRRP